MANTSCGVQTFVGSASRVAAKLGRVRVAVQAAAHRQQLGDGDVLAVGHVRNVLRYRIAELELAFLGQQHNHRRRHCLGDGGDPEVSVTGRRHSAPRSVVPTAAVKSPWGVRTSTTAPGISNSFDGRVHGGLKRGRVDRLQRGRAARRGGSGPSRSMPASSSSSSAAITRTTHTASPVTRTDPRTRGNRHRPTPERIPAPTVHDRLASRNGMNTPPDPGRVHDLIHTGPISASSQPPNGSATMRVAIATARCGEGSTVKVFPPAPP